MRFTFIPGLKYVVSPACKTGTPVLVANVSKGLVQKPFDANSLLL